MNSQTLMFALRKRLHDCGRTQDEIAEATGIAQSTVGRVMRGDTIPRLDTYETLIDYLDGFETPARSKRGRPRTPLIPETKEAGAV